jgi:hypothetical protein
MTILKLVAAGALLFLALLLSGIAVCYFGIGSETASGLSREGLLSLRPGMTTNQVTRAIGEPLRRRTEPGRNQVIWIYSEPGFCLEGLEVYVLMQGGNVYSVHIEHFDLGVFLCDEHACPRILDTDKFENVFQHHGNF